MASTAAGQRPPIAESWRRANMAGLDPTSAFERLTYADVDLSSPLLRAASPVLEQLNDQLRGTMFSSLLVDRDGRVAQRWTGSRGAGQALDDLGLDVGASLLEEAVGTNALGTVLETRTSITINGGEHFAVPLRRFSCYGHPIFHPATRRIEGVLDLTAAVEEASPLLPPLVARAVADIEKRLLDGSQVSASLLLAAFQAVAVRRRAVVAVGEDLLMSNRAALDLLDSTDLALLRIIGTDLGSSRSQRVDLTLQSGIRVRVRAERVVGTTGGALLHVAPTKEMAPVHRSPDVRRSTGASAVATLVSGAPGTGRSTRAAALAGDRAFTTLTAAAALLDGRDAWIRDFRSLVRSGQGVVCIDGIDLLPDDLLDLVHTHVKSGTLPAVTLISGPADALTGRCAALAAECAHRVEMPALAHRATELPHIVSALLVDIGARPGTRLTAGALAAVSAQPWPGNLRELRSALSHAVSRSSGRLIGVGDLPEPYHSETPARAMAPIERAERDVIAAALSAHGGNKLRAAAELGISRTTLYAKMRSLRITTY